MSKKTVVRVATKNNNFPERRRAGHVFTPEAKAVSLDEEQLRLVRADDALVVYDVGDESTDESLKNEVAALTERVTELEGQLAAAGEYTAALEEELAKHGLDKPAGVEPEPTKTDKVGDDFGNGDAAIPSLDHTRTRVTGRRTGGKG